jgi:hypothetical protein
MTPNEYLYRLLDTYRARDLSAYSQDLANLKANLKSWAQTCYLSAANSGSYAKGTAISLSSDVDILVSLTNDCHRNDGGLKKCYESLEAYLRKNYSGVRAQNVSIRINLNGLEVDITPARKLSGNTNYHSIYTAKTGSYKQTSIQKHINDISSSGRTDEIRLLKIWRHRNKLDIPSIYLEYLLVLNVLKGRSKSAEALEDNFLHVLNQLALGTENPLFKRLVDPANSANELSSLMTDEEKLSVVLSARQATQQKTWDAIVY